MSYLVLKYIHVLGAIALQGTGTGIAFRRSTARALTIGIPISLAHLFGATVVIPTLRLGPFGPLGNESADVPADVDRPGGPE